MGFLKGQAWTGARLALKSQTPASLLKNPPLLRFEKLFIVICWFCLGPVMLSMAGSERRGKRCVKELSMFSHHISEWSSVLET